MGSSIPIVFQLRGMISHLGVMGFPMECYPLTMPSTSVCYALQDAMPAGILAIAQPQFWGK